jgi:hypothetical protein
MATMKELNPSDASLTRGLRIIALVVVIGIITAAGERMMIAHDATARAAPTLGSDTPAAVTTTDYFPARFPAPTGEAEPHVEAF